MTYAGSDTPVLDLDGVLAALGIAAQDAEPCAPYTVIRGHDGPRWLIPQASLLARTILSEWRPYGLLTRLVWLTVPAANRLGVLPLLPGSSRALLPANASNQFLRHIGLDFDAGPPVVLVGNATTTRKLLVFLEHRSRGKNVLVKVPLKPLARASIANEAKILGKLNGRLHAPRLLHVSADAGVAMQEYLAGTLGSRRCRPQYIQLLLALIESGSFTSLRAHGQRLAMRLRNCAAYAGNAYCLEQALALLEHDADLPSVLVHGDFAPWNIRELPGGACTLIDWEMAREHGLPLHDLCHFYYMQARLFTPGRLFYLALLKEDAWRMYLAPLGISASLLKPLAAAFLLTMLAGYWERQEDEWGQYCLGQLALLLAPAQ